MKENKLKEINGKKIRRQYFNAPLIILYSVMLAIPYMIFVTSLCMGKYDPTAWPDTLWTSVWVCFCFSLPILLLRELNKHFFGRIICVLTDEGIHYPTGKLHWETIEKIEYAIDAKPRYKTDPAKAYRVILYTKGGKRIALANAPMRIVTCIKKYRKGIDVKIAGASSLLPVTLVIAAIIAISPFYVFLLANAPAGLTVPKLATCFIIFVALGIIRSIIFNKYAIQYRFWRRILPIKWLSYIILGCYYSSGFVIILVLVYFPNWVVVSLAGIYMGIVQPPVPSRHGRRNHRRIMSYEQLYEAYVNSAGLWEKKIEKSKEKGLIKKD